MRRLWIAVLALLLVMAAGTVGYVVLDTGTERV
jgi:hypothetical protein